ncbi:MAG: hypothetical protein WCI11_09900 [Candidatus Methylumidiphilus sp.]
MPETPAKAGLFRPTFGFFREVIFNQVLIDPDDLRQEGVVYQPDQISLDVFGLHVDLLPKWHSVVARMELAESGKLIISDAIAD